MYQALEKAAQATGKQVVLVECGWFDNELVIEIIELFEDEDYDDISDEIKEYIVKVIK